MTEVLASNTRVVKDRGTMPMHIRVKRKSNDVFESILSELWMKVVKPVLNVLYASVSSPAYLFSPFPEQTDSNAYRIHPRWGGSFHAFFGVQRDRSRLFLFMQQVFMGDTDRVSPIVSS